MRIFYLGNTTDVDLVACEKGDPCAYDHTCRIHRLFAFLKQAGLVCERSSLDPPPSPTLDAPGAGAVRVWAGDERAWHPFGWVLNHAKIEIGEDGFQVDGRLLTGSTKRAPHYPVVQHEAQRAWALTVHDELPDMLDPEMVFTTPDGLRYQLGENREPIWLDAERICEWCDGGSPRVMSSVTRAFVHTDTPVGRVLCKDQKTGRDEVVCTECLHHGADPSRAHSNPKCKYAGLANALPEGFPRECEFGRID